MYEMTEKEFNKGMVMNILLSLLTCGIFFWMWIFRLTNRIAKLLKEQEKGGAVVVLSLLTCGIYLFVWHYQMGEKLHRLGVKNISGGKSILLTLFSGGIGILVSYDKELFILENNGFKDQILDPRAVELRKGDDKRVAYQGFSWTTFFFAQLPAFFRRDYDNAIIIPVTTYIIVVVWYVLLYIAVTMNLSILVTILIVIICIIAIGMPIILGCFYNKMHKNRLEKDGYTKA